GTTLAQSGSCCSSSCCCPSEARHRTRVAPHSHVGDRKIHRQRIASRMSGGASKLYSATNRHLRSGFRALAPPDRRSLMLFHRFRAFSLLVPAVAACSAATDSHSPGGGAVSPGGAGGAAGAAPGAGSAGGLGSVNGSGSTTGAGAAQVSNNGGTPDLGFIM